MAFRKLRPPTTPPRKIAPGNLGIIQAFCNSPHVGNRLDNPDALADWLVEKGLANDTSVVTYKAFRDALQLRDDFRTVLRLRRGEPWPQDVLARLNEPVDWHYRVRVDERGHLHRTAQLPAEWPGVRQRLISFMHRAIAEKNWTRLHFCENDVCPWIFYDGTNGQRGRWCRPKCGNVHIQRKFRRRA